MEEKRLGWAVCKITLSCIHVQDPRVLDQNAKRDYKIKNNSTSQWRLYKMKTEYYNRYTFSSMQFQKNMQVQKQVTKKDTSYWL